MKRPIDLRRAGGAGAGGAPARRWRKAIEPGALPPHEILTIAALDRPRAARPAGAARPELRAARDRRRRPRGPRRGRRALRRHPVGDAGCDRAADAAAAAATPWGPTSGCRRATSRRAAYRAGRSGPIDDDDDAPPPRGYRQSRRVRRRDARAPLPRSSNAVPPPRGGAMAPSMTTTTLSPPSGAARHPGRSGPERHAAAAAGAFPAARGAARAAQAQAGDARRRGAAQGCAAAEAQARWRRRSVSAAAAAITGLVATAGQPAGTGQDGSGVRRDAALTQRHKIKAPRGFRGAPLCGGTAEVTSGRVRRQPSSRPPAAWLCR